MSICLIFTIGPTDEVSLLTGLLKTDEPSSGKVVVRKGTTDDILQEHPQTEKTVEQEASKDDRHLPDASYTQEEFEREFGDGQPVDDYDADPRRVANFEIVERNDVTVEEAAGKALFLDTISSDKSDSDAIWHHFESGLMCPAIQI